MTSCWEVFNTSKSFPHGLKCPQRSESIRVKTLLGCSCRSCSCSSGAFGILRFFFFVSRSGEGVQVHSPPFLWLVSDIHVYWLQFDVWEQRGGVALDEALSIIQRCSVKSEVLRVLLLDFSFFSLGVEVKHRANTNSFPVFQKDKSARTSFLHQTAGSDFFFFSLSCQEILLLHQNGG